MNHEDAITADQWVRLMALMDKEEIHRLRQRVAVLEVENHRMKAMLENKYLAFLPPDFVVGVDLAKDFSISRSVQ